EKIGKTFYSMSLADAEDVLNRLSEISDHLEAVPLWSLWDSFATGLSYSVRDPQMHLAELPFYARVFNDATSEVRLVQGDSVQLYVLHKLLRANSNEMM